VDWDNLPVLFYTAYDPDFKRTDWVIGPEQLDEFTRSMAYIAGVADQFYVFTAGSEYQVESAKMMERLMNSDPGGAFKSLGRAWWKAIIDPSWYLQNLGSIADAAGRVPRGPRPFAAAAGRKLSRAEMGAHLAATWEANPILREAAELNTIAKRNAPKLLEHPVELELHAATEEVLDKFQNETRTWVEKVPEGQVQRATRTWGTKNPNRASLNTRPGYLQIEEQVFKDSALFKNEVQHEMAAYYTGAPPNSNIPVLAGDTPWPANDLMELTIQGNGKLPPMVTAPPPPLLGRLMAALVAARPRLKYPPKDDDEAKKLLDESGLQQTSADGTSDPFRQLLQGLSGTGTAPAQPQSSGGEIPAPPSIPVPNELSSTLDQDKTLVLSKLPRNRDSREFAQLVVETGLSSTRLQNALWALARGGSIRVLKWFSQAGQPTPGRVARAVVR
jgi:hypothetical protein